MTVPPLLELELLEELSVPGSAGEGDELLEEFPVFCPGAGLEDVAAGELLEAPVLPDSSTR